MTLLRPGQVTIGRLNLRGTQLESLSAQRQAAYLLNQVSLRPPGLPETAILCVRKFRDPRPGSLQLARRETEPHPQWKQAVTEALDHLTRRAARPALGAVPAEAEAVLFMDQAELLACLANDWQAGLVVGRWWWQSLFPRTDPLHLIPHAWLESPEHVPAMLGRLAEMRRAEIVISVLDSTEAYTVVQSIVRRFALRDLASAIQPIGVSPTVTVHNPLVNNVADPGFMKVERRSPNAPWRKWVPERNDSTLGVAQQLLLGVGLMLHRAPALARAPTFAQEVAAWLEAARASETYQPASPIPTALVMTTDTSAQDREVRSTTILPEGVENDAVGSGDTAPEVSESHPALVKHAKFTHHINASTSTSLDTVRPVVDEVESIREQAARARTGLNTTSSPPALEWLVESRFGGLFYLINLGLFLNLYGDFTTPAAPGLALPVWDFVALVGRRLIGEAVERDPIWPLLATLSGRHEGEAPGWNFEPPAEWQISSEWLAPFPESTAWCWSAAQGRLRVDHPEGFCVLDVPRSQEDPKVQLASHLSIYAEYVAFALSRERAAQAMRRSPLERWLDWLMPYLTARLKRAFGLTEAEPSDLPRLLIEHPARIKVTAARVDIELSLAELPIAIRLAGLDRDPGWVPAAGRAIAFHFE